MFAGGLLLGFNLEPDTAVEEHAKRLGVRIMTYKVIYDLIDDVKVCVLIYRYVARRAITVPT